METNVYSSAHCNGGQQDRLLKYAVASGSPVGQQRQRGQVTGV